MYMNYFLLNFIIAAINKTSFGSSLVKVGSTILMCFIEGSLAKKSLENVKYASIHEEKNKYIGNFENKAILIDC